MPKRVRGMSRRKSGGAASDKSLRAAKIREGVLTRKGPGCPYCKGRRFRERRVRRRIVLVTCLGCGKTWIKGDDGDRPS